MTGSMNTKTVFSASNPSFQTPTALCGEVLVAWPPVSCPFWRKNFPKWNVSLKSCSWNQFGETLVVYGDKKFNEKRFFLSEPAIFEIFTIPLLKGNPRTALQDPNGLVISESMAKKYFGQDNPLGKMLKVNHLLSGTNAPKNRGRDERYAGQTPMFISTSSAHC